MLNTSLTGCERETATYIK